MSVVLVQGFVAAPFGGRCSTLALKVTSDSTRPLESPATWQFAAPPPARAACAAKEPAGRPREGGATAGKSAGWGLSVPMRPFLARGASAPAGGTAQEPSWTVLSPLSLLGCGPRVSTVVYPCGADLVGRLSREWVAGSRDDAELPWERRAPSLPWRQLQDGHIGAGTRQSWQRRGYRLPPGIRWAAGSETSTSQSGGPPRRCSRR